MFLEDYPYNPNIEVCDRVYSKGKNLSGWVNRVFGKKCSVLLDGTKKIFLVTFDKKDLVKEGHVDYKVNSNSYLDFSKTKLKKYRK